MAYTFYSPHQQHTNPSPLPSNNNTHNSNPSPSIVEDMDLLLPNWLDQQWMAMGSNNDNGFLFNYIDDHTLSLYDDVLFPDFQMFPALPPLGLCAYDQQADQCQVNGTFLTEQRLEEIVLEADEKVDAAEMELITVSNGGSQIRAKSWARAKSDKLHFGDLQKYFDRPISEASQELKVRITLLKKRCRELGIRRWPHRKLRSLNSLIENVKELGMDEEVMMLEEQRKMLLNQPEMELNEQAKKIRQKSFKANHMRRRKMGVVRST